MQTSNDNEAFFTIDELAARWRCQRNTVAAAIRSGRLQAFKVNERRYRISAAEVVRFENANMTKTKAS